MKKLLLVAMLIVGLCLATAVGNCAANDLGWTDRDVKEITGNTGLASLKVQQKTFHFDNIQPGETLAVSWWIENDGPCPLVITVDVGLTGSGGNVTGWLVPVFYPGLILHLGSNIQKNVALTVHLYPNAPDSTAGRDFWVTVTFNSTADGDRQESPSYNTF